MQGKQVFLKKRGVEECAFPHITPNACRRQFAFKRKINPSPHLEAVEAGGPQCR